MRHALLVSYYFPPRFSVGGKRAYRFAKYLPSHGWSTTVLTAPALVDERLDRSVGDADLPHCDVRRTYLSDAEVRAIPKRELGSDGTVDKPTNLSVPLAKKTGIARIRGEMKVVPIIGPDVRKLPRLASRIARAAKQSGAEVIFASGSPWEAPIAASAAARALRLPIIIDFRDPWTFGPVMASRPSWARAVDRLAERAVIRSADMLTVTSDATRDAYAKIAKSARVERIRNAFDPAQIVAPRRDERVTLIHFGNCYCGRTLEPFLRAFAAVVKKRGVGPEGARVLNLGRVAAEDERLAESLGIASMFEHQTVLPYAEGVALVAGADLALLQGYGEDPWFLPAKLYDYLLTRTPTLAISTSAELAAILEKTKLGWAYAAEDVSSLAQRIDDAFAARERKERLITPDEAAITEMAAPATAGRLAQLFDEVARR